MGWLETILRGSDEVHITIPNSELLSQQLCNLSRIEVCQVQQTLRFHFRDSDKLPKLVEDIKQEIQATCPELITDGSRPFRCYFANYKEDHLEVNVDTRFRIKPVGDAYFQNRQKVLLAINQAVRNNDMKFFERKYFYSKD